MKIMVAAKRVIDPNAPLRLDNAGLRVESRHVPHSINPFDEVAIARAVKMRHEGEAAEVLAVSIGGEKSADTLRTALGMGADRALHVTWPEDIESPPSLAAAHIFHHLAQREKPDLILMGKQASDSDAGQTPAMLAALLGWAFAPAVHELEARAGGLRLAYQIDGLEIWAQAAPPLVASVELHLCRPAPLGLAQIMKSRQKPIESIAVGELGEGPEKAAYKGKERIGLRTRAPRGDCLMAGSASELLDCLRREGVLK